MTQLHLFQWPGFQRVLNWSTEPGLFYELVDVGRLEADVDVSGKTVFNLAVDPLPVATELSPLALAPFVSEEAAAAVREISPNMSVMPAKELRFEEPDGRTRVFHRLRFDPEDPLSVGWLSAQDCEPPLPQRDAGEPVGAYRSRLLASADAGRRYAINPAGLPACAVFEFAPIRGLIVATEGFRSAWNDSAISTEIESNGWANIAFSPLEERAQWYFSDDADSGVPGPGPVEEPRLHRVSLYGPTQPEIDDNEADQPTRHVGPVDASLLSDEINELLIQGGPTALPAGTVIPLTRALRHVEFEYSVISTELYKSLVSIAGSTISSRNRIWLAGQDGESSSYEYVTFGPRRHVSITGGNCVPPLPDPFEDARTELHQRAASGTRTSIAVPPSMATSVEVLFVEHVGGPVVTDAFIAALDATPVGQQMQSDADDGLVFTEVPRDTGTLTWHWSD